MVPQSNWSVNEIITFIVQTWNTIYMFSFKNSWNPKTSWPKNLFPMFAILKTIQLYIGRKACYTAITSPEKVFNIGFFSL